MYAELANWWPLLSPPPHYVEEAEDLLPLLFGDLTADAGAGVRNETRPTLLELGSGGGSLAFHLKRHFNSTLTDISPAMVDVNRQLNPECEHIVGDMRTLDLGRLFDRVLVHDAIMYATDPAAARATLRTAARHCRPGGRVVVVPDCVRETFEPETEHGGEDAPAPDRRALRYLMWTWDPDPTDTTFDVIYTFVLRDAEGRITVEQDRHREGVFPRADWLAWFEEAGLQPRIHVDPWARDVFIGINGSNGIDSR